MQCNLMHPIFDSFYSIQKKWSELGTKTDFLANFARFSVSALQHPISYAPILGQIKSLMKIYNRGKFHLYIVCGCQVINFHMFSW